MGDGGLVPGGSLLTSPSVKTEKKTEQEEQLEAKAQLLILFLSVVGCNRQEQENCKMKSLFEAPVMTWMSLLSFMSTSRDHSENGYYLRRKRLMSMARDEETYSSRWSERTAKKRNRTGKLLDSIDLPKSYGPKSSTTTTPPTMDIPTLCEAPEIDWHLYPHLDPQGVEGGNLKPNSMRSTRKRRQIEAFCYALEHFVMKSFDSEGQGGAGKNGINGYTLIDAGSGAGNLSIPLTGILQHKIHKTYALDVNPVALDRLQNRANDLQLTVETVCVDLADAEEIVVSIKNEHLQRHDNVNGIIVCSLHACGAATDLALRLATHQNLPFIVSPCCTAKAITQRPHSPSSSKIVFERNPNINKFPTTTEEIVISASFHRSGAPIDIVYPRSSWLRTFFTTDSAKQYTMLAKAADIGIGPQTSNEQVDHQQRAKLFIEIDRLMEVVENNDYYEVAMYRIKDHEMYGKSELLLGIPKS